MPTGTLASITLPGYYPLAARTGPSFRQYLETAPRRPLDSLFSITVRTDVERS
ncbi:MAG: hypothetical protein OXC05_03935 [Halieaceae bacterium]|nr:hypothetical protein [Halieaceae bacterium]